MADSKVKKIEVWYKRVESKSNRFGFNNRALIEYLAKERSE